MHESGFQFKFKGYYNSESQNSKVTSNDLSSTLKCDESSLKIKSNYKINLNSKKSNITESPEFFRKPLTLTLV